MPAMSFSAHRVSYQTLILALRQQTEIILNVIYHKLTATSEFEQFLRDKTGSFSLFLNAVSNIFKMN